MAGGELMTIIHQYCKEIIIDVRDKGIDREARHSNLFGVKFPSFWCDCQLNYQQILRCLRRGDSFMPLV